ncbi:MAG: regulatory protein RecX [Candidatus Levybacteria bacterium]|nr:regulatory protein RecX [Candidatus Levybacteria bacterium]
MVSTPEDNFEKFYNSALRFLSYRSRSEKEVRDRLYIKYQKLNIKNLSLVIDKAIAKLKEKNFINDKEFTKWWIESRLRFKPRSFRLIKIELKQKGINSDLIDSLIHNSQSMIQSDLEQAKKLVEKRIERFKDLPKQEVYQKLGRFLASKGFDWDTIKKSIDEALGKVV